MASTAAEQMLLELINDARLDPVANAERFIKSFSKGTSSDPQIQNALDFFNVDTKLFLKQISKMPSVDPLAWNDKLASSARSHNKQMIAKDAQAHSGIGDGDPFSRMEAKGYHFSTAGENIYAYGSNALEIHAAFMIDWGGSAASGGMQDPAGHRKSIMYSGFREVGVGVTAENKASTEVGPLVTTQDFGTRFGGPAVFVLGVAYQDKDKDGFYSIGEGVSKLKVSLGSGSATTASSGGYTLETNATGKETVSFSGGGLTGTVKAQIKVAAGDNVKLDIVDGHTLRTSVSATVSGSVSTLEGLGREGLVLKTGSGSQTIVGTSGKDTLTGGSGADKFVFDTKLGTGNIDRITDFRADQDKVVLDHDIFTKVALGKLDSDAFHLGASAADKEDRILYDHGKLFYDADGKGGAAAVQFAALDNMPKLDHLDFLVV